MIHGVLEESAELASVILGLFAAASLLSRRHPRWAASFHHRRMGVLLLIAAAVVLVQVTEEVVGQESTVFDRAVLLAVHARIPDFLLPAFNAVTMSGSSHVLVPVVAALAVGLWWRGHRFEAVQLAASMAAAGLVIYLAKTAVGRARPDLWSTQWFWGSSFPSGHTLASAAVATALCLAAARLDPRHRHRAVALALPWVALVGLSRLVLGVHWPTDVAAAACAGLLTATGVNAALAWLWRRGRTQPADAPETSAETMP